MSTRTVNQNAAVDADEAGRFWLSQMKQLHLNEGPLEVDVVYSGESKNPLHAARAAVLLVKCEFSHSLDSAGSLRDNAPKWVREVFAKAQDFGVDKSLFIEAAIARRVALCLSEFCMDIVAECGRSAAYSLSSPRLSMICADQSAFPGCIGIELYGSGAYSSRTRPEAGKAVCLAVAEDDITAMESNLKLCRLLDSGAPCAEALEAVCGGRGVTGALAVQGGNIHTFGLAVDTEC